jgi:Rod binding domain-containing protein
MDQTLSAAASATYSPPATLPTASPEKRAQIEKTAKAFEASFISTMLGEMSVGTDAEAPFSGGEGEKAFKSFLNDAMAKSVVAHGGVGLSKSIASEMLKMQGLS